MVLLRLCVCVWGGVHVALGQERVCNLGPDTVKLYQCRAGRVISTSRFVFDHSWGGEVTAHLLFLPPLFQALLDFLSASGYILTRPRALPVCLQVISGSNLPFPGSGKALDPFVRVEIYGIPSDACKKNTHTVKHNCKCHEAGRKSSRRD